MLERFRIFATCDIGDGALPRLRAKGWDLEVYDRIDPPARELILPLPADSPLRDDALKLKLRMFHHFASGGRATRLTGARRGWALLAATAVLLAARAAAADTPAAVAEARRCWSTVGEPGIAACRRALDAGLTPSRASRVELTLATRLAGLGRGDEAADVHRAAVARRPQDGEAHRRLGAALLHGLGRPSEAEGSLREAIRLGAREARTWGDLGLALVALGRLPDAVTAFDEALHLDPKFLDGRPGSRAAYEAARAGGPWPPPSPGGP